MTEEPTLDVGTELLFDNELVRVWSMELAPDEASPFHRHTHNYVYVYVTPSTLTSIVPGASSTTTDFEDGYVRFVNVSSVRPHRIVNSGTRRHRQIIVELKQPAPTESGDNGRKSSGG
jgi:hypothetical protein